VRVTVPSTSEDGALRRADSRLSIEHGFGMQDRELVTIEALGTEDFFSHPKFEEAVRCPVCADNTALYWPADLAAHIKSQHPEVQRTACSVI
jgi:hypothetical protein